MNPITFLTANYVALPLGFHIRDWGQGDSATNELFRGTDRFQERFDAILERVQDLGFEAVDLWMAHLNPSWATVQHVETAKDLLAKRGLSVTAFLGHAGSGPDFVALARIMGELGAGLISGGAHMLAGERDRLADLLRGHGLRLAYENHPERSVDEILSKLGDGHEDVFGVALDTGWAGSQGFDAAEAVTQLGSRLFHLHLKDVKPRREAPSGYQLIDMGHETCALGDGIVDCEGAVKAAIAGGYQGSIGIEHEPETHNPEEEIALSLERVKGWIAEA